MIAARRARCSWPARCRRTSRRAACRGRGRGWPRAGTGSTCPSAADCWMPSGVSTPWLMALFRNSTLAGSMMMLASGSRLCSTSQSTPLPSAVARRRRRSARTRRSPTTASTAAAMPAEKLLTSISKPGLILPSQMLVELLHHPGGQRAHDHRADEHRLLGADDHAHGRRPRRPRRRGRRRPSGRPVPRSAAAAGTGSSGRPGRRSAPRRRPMPKPPIAADRERAPSR